MAGSKFNIENGLHVTGDANTANSIFEHDVTVNGRVRVNGDLLFVTGNLQVLGSTLYTTNVTSDIIPSTNATYQVGNSSLFFSNGYFANLYVGVAALPTTNGVNLGNTSSRFNTFSTNVNASGVVTISGNTTVGANALLVDTTNLRVSVNTSSPNTSAAMTVGGNVVIQSGSVTANSAILANALITTNTATVTNTSLNDIDGWTGSQGKCAKLLLFVTDGGTNVHSLEMLLIHEGTNVLITKYAEIYNSSLGEFSAAISGGNVTINFTAAAPGTYTVKSVRQMIT